LQGDLSGLASMVSRMTEDLATRIHAAVRTRADETVELLRALVRFPSVSDRGGAGGQEGPAQAFLAERMRAVGLAGAPVEAGPGTLDHPDHVGPRADFRGRPDVFARWPGTGEAGAGGGRSLILNGHIDVVLEGDPAERRHPPFGGDLAEGKV